MTIDEFKEKYTGFKDIDKIEIMCDHIAHDPAGEVIVIGKQPARRNILKNGGTVFVCRKCFMKHDNPVNRIGNSRQTDEEIIVYCPHPAHTGDLDRTMKKACYYGEMKEPYVQVCGSCAQLGKVISDKQKQAISDKLSGRKLSAQHLEKILAWRANHPEWAEKAKKNLIPGMGGIVRKGLPLPDDWKHAISESTKGIPKTEDAKQNISEGRKKMLAETGGFTREHREKISRAVIEQYKKGFEPKLHHVHGWHESPKAGRVYYRSSYEKKAYLKLDEDIDVKTYHAEAVAVLYFHPIKKIDSSYLIDIDIEYIHGSKKMVEIKPASWLDDKVIQAKIKAAEAESQRLNIPFETWTEMDLFGHVYNEKNMRSFLKKVRNEEV